MSSVTAPSRGNTYIEAIASQRPSQRHGIAIPANTLGILLCYDTDWSLIPLPAPDDSAGLLSADEVQLLREFATNRAVFSQQIRRITVPEMRNAWLARAVSTLQKTFPEVDWVQQLSEATGDGPPPVSRRRLTRLTVSNEDDIGPTSDHYASPDTSGGSAGLVESLMKIPRKRRRGEHSLTLVPASTAQSISNLAVTTGDIDRHDSGSHRQDARPTGVVPLNPSPVLVFRGQHAMSAPLQAVYKAPELPLPLSQSIRYLQAALEHLPAAILVENEREECRCGICRRQWATRDQRQWLEVLAARAKERSRAEAIAVFGGQLEGEQDVDGKDIPQDIGHVADDDKDDEDADGSKGKGPRYCTGLLNKTLESRDVALGQPLAGSTRMFARTLRAVQREQGRPIHDLRSKAQFLSPRRNAAMTTGPPHFANHRPAAVTRGMPVKADPLAANARVVPAARGWRPRLITRRRFYELLGSKNSVSSSSEGEISRRARFSTLSPSPPPDAVHMPAPLPGREHPTRNPPPLEFDDSSDDGNDRLFEKRRRRRPEDSSASSFTIKPRAPSAQSNWKEFFWKAQFGDEEDEPRQFPRGGNVGPRQQGTSTMIADDEDTAAVVSDGASYQSTVDWFADEERDRLVRAHEVAEDVVRAGGHRLRYQQHQFRHDHAVRDDVLNSVTRAASLVVSCLDPLNKLTWSVRGRMRLPNWTPRPEDPERPFRNQATYRTMVSDKRTKQQGVDRRGIRGWRLNVEQATSRSYGQHNNSDRARLDDMLRTIRQIQDRLAIIVRTINHDELTRVEDSELLAETVENIYQAEMLLGAVQEQAYNGTYTGPCRFPGYELSDELADDTDSSITDALSDAEANLDAVRQSMLSAERALGYDGEEGEDFGHLDEEYFNDEDDEDDVDLTVQWEEVKPLDEEHVDYDADFDGDYAGEELGAVVQDSTYDIENASTTSTTGSSPSEDGGANRVSFDSRVRLEEGVLVDNADAELDAALWDAFKSLDDASTVSTSGSSAGEYRAEHLQATLPGLDEVMLDEALFGADGTTLATREDASSAESSRSSTNETTSGSSSSSLTTLKDSLLSESWEVVPRAGP